MIRVLVSLCKAVSLVAADGQAGASTLPTEAFSRPAINCEQPGNATAATALRPEVDMGSILRQLTTQSDTISQMEAWWRERGKSSDVTQGKPAHSTMKEALDQMDAWWRERTDLHNGIAPEQAPSGMKEAMAQMQAWWEQSAKLGHTSASKPAPATHHRRHRQASAPTIEYGCPPSVCTIQYGN